MRNNSVIEHPVSHYIKNTEVRKAMALLKEKKKVEEGVNTRIQRKRSIIIMTA